MEFELICNFRHCRRRIEDHAWVTSCSHIFCDHDGQLEFSKKLACPACDAGLPGKFDIFRINMNPTEQFKSMVLAGQNPETIFEVCSRAMSFWNYQIFQEKLYQEWVSKKLREQAAISERRYEELVTKLQCEIKTMKEKLACACEELNAVVRRYECLAERYNEKVRENIRLKANQPVMQHSFSHSAFQGVGKLEERR
ncbi:zf-RING 5 domain containing protein [Trichuris trichiura]|uniref:Zf-RING 5 domain containing protein n=1 Tax=Trichuris trichiura TaxID=36087 RepID=A0A077ZBD3_TRITR|nr:zf-RING 5 domain containing protein [Trichuris trichiura]